MPSGKSTFLFPIYRTWPDGLCDVWAFYAVKGALADYDALKARLQQQMTQALITDIQAASVAEDKLRSAASPRAAQRVGGRRVGVPARRSGPRALPPIPVAVTVADSAPMNVSFKTLCAERQRSFMLGFVASSDVEGPAIARVLGIVWEANASAFTGPGHLCASVSRADIISAVPDIDHRHRNAWYPLDRMLLEPAPIDPRAQAHVHEEPEAVPVTEAAAVAVEE